MNEVIATRQPEDVIGITQDLIRIPSFVKVYDEKGATLPTEHRVDENNVVSYITDFLQKNTSLSLETTDTGDSRLNLIAKNTDNPKLVLLGHTDTVHPSEGGRFDQFGGNIVDERIYGLGAADMKSGVASILSAVAMAQELPEMMIALYTDEEYNFAGMHSLVEQYGHIKPQLIFSADGSDMTVGHGCRGLVELHGILRGKAAHAGRPYLGVNAINGIVDSMRFLETRLGNFKHEQLGSSTVNLARVDGGKAAKDPMTGEILVFEQINSVPDIAKFKVDIRTSSPDLNPERIIEYLTEYTEENRLHLEGVYPYHNLGAWFTERSDLSIVNNSVVEEMGTIVYDDPSTSGFIDLQMLWDRVGRPPAAMIGAGPKEVAHQADEYVEVNTLVKSRDIFLRVITNFDK